MYRILPKQSETLPLDVQSLDLQAAMEDFRKICKESKSGAKAYEYGTLNLDLEFIGSLTEFDV